MRIAFVTYNFEDRALTSGPFHLSCELAKRGHEVTLIALSRQHRFRPERRTQNSVRILLTPRGITGRWHYDGWDPNDILTRLLHFYREKYDVMAFFDCRPNVYLPFRFAKGRTPLRLMYWGDLWGEGGLATGASRFAWQKRFEERWEKEMAIQADGILTSSQLLGNLACHWGVPDYRMPAGSPIDLIQRHASDAARQRLGLDGAHPIIGYMGHAIGPLTTFFPALQRVVRRYPRTVVLCIGACNDKAKIRSKLETFGLVSHFRFAGFVPMTEVGNWLACADFLLIPASSSPVNARYRIAGKLGEYMAAGRPAIAPSLGETARIIREEKIGLLAREDLADLEERMVELIENPALAEELGARARRAAEEHFAWPVLADRFEEFIQNLKAHTRSGSPA